MAPDFKFEWMKAVAADPRIPQAERFLLALVGFVYAYQSDTFRVRQSTIAERFAVNVRTVKRAYRSARELGYLAVVAERQRGLGGKSDAYRIRLPEAVGDSVSPTHEVGDTDDQSRGHDCTEYGTQTTEVGDTANAATCENDVPKYLSSSKYSFGEWCGEAAHTLPDVIPEEEPAVIDAEIVDDDPDPEPDPWCQDHMPYGENDDCRKCLRARKRHDEWLRRANARAAERLFASAPTRDERPAREFACSWCHDTNIVRSSDGAPTGRGCNHNGTYRDPTPEEDVQIEQLRKAIGQ